MTITGVNLTVAAGIVAAIGDISRFKSPQKLVSYFGLNPRGPGCLDQHGARVTAAVLPDATMMGDSLSRLPKGFHRKRASSSGTANLSKSEMR
jgi:hypothetical protein